MRFLENLLTRRRSIPDISTVSPRVLRRMSLACRELAEAEAAIAERLGLDEPPRLLLIDEEQGVILDARHRSQLTPGD